MDTNRILLEKRLLLVGSYPPAFGGVSSFIRELEIGLASRVRQFYVLHFDVSTSIVSTGPQLIIHKLPNRPNSCLFSALSLGPLRLLHVLVLFLSNSHKDVRLYSSSLLQALIIAMIAKKNKSNVVTIFTTRAGAVIPYLSRLIPGTPIYYCVFADPYKNPVFYKKHNSWYRDAMLRSRRVFSSSKYCAGVTKFFDSSIKPEVIYVGVDTSRFHPSTPQLKSRQKLNLPMDKQVILSVARMEAEMGVPDILKIAEKVLSVLTNAIFVIAGARGSATPMVEDAAQASGGRIFCRINVPFDDLPLYYSASSIVIAPTIGVHACMGVSVKEAMAAGKPVVVSDSGGLPEAVQNNHNGIIVQLNGNGTINCEKFSEVILDLLQDTGKQYVMGSNSRLKAVTMFSADSSTSSYAKLIIGSNC